MATVGTLDSIPLNLQASNTFKLVFSNIPNLVYNIRRARIPEVGVVAINVPTGGFTMEDFTVPGDKITYGDLVLDVLLDENFDTWLEVWQWMNNMIVSKGKGLGVGELKKEMRDASLILQTNKFNPNIKYKFYDLWPTSLGDIDLSYDTGPKNVLSFQVVFKYRKFEPEVI